MKNFLKYFSNLCLLYLAFLGFKSTKIKQKDSIHIQEVEDSCYVEINNIDNFSSKRKNKMKGIIKNESNLQYNFLTKGKLLLHFMILSRK